MYILEAYYTCIGKLKGLKMTSYSGVLAQAYDTTGKHSMIIGIYENKPKELYFRLSKQLTKKLHNQYEKIS